MSTLFFTRPDNSQGESIGSMDRPIKDFAEVLTLSPKAIHPLYTATNVVMTYNDPQKLELDSTSRMKNR
jgi:hypothetical protein